MGEVDYTRMYELQDRVLAAVFSGQTSFYLTGGTCLNRFYLEKRYSDDLDFFTNDAALYRTDIREAQTAILEIGLSCDTQVDTRDFVRVLVDQTLQVDLVNDRLPHLGRPTIVSNAILLDSIENIAANKITAVLGRDEAKDVFDLYLISKCISVDWTAVIAGARKKAIVDLEELERRLREFPLQLLDQLPVSDDEFVNEIKSRYGSFVDAIVTGESKTKYGMST